jgi:hypothetical protein
MPVTIIKDVARESGVNTYTVSGALNNGYGVKDKTRDLYYVLAGLVLYAISRTTPVMTRVFPRAHYSVRRHFIVGAQIASLFAASVHRCHPNLPSPFAFINSVVPSKYLFDDHRP